MGNLEAKSTMSPWQLAIVTVMLGVAAPSSEILEILDDAANGAWLSILLGGVLSYGAAWLMLKLGDYYPGETFAEYMPRIWGKWLGIGIVLLFVAALFFMAGYMLQVSSREITFFMFDRTPLEMVAISMLAVCTYCALQDWGTILRITQLVFFTAFPAWLLLLVSGFLSFKFINIMPLWPVNAGGAMLGGLYAIGLFAGYECILMLQPLVYRRNSKPALAVGAAFVLTTAIFLMWIILSVGTLTLEGAKGVPFPLATMMRNVDVPGTFIERLDTYFLLFWIQTIFVFISLMMFLIARALAQLCRHVDHRPWVVALAPLVFLVGDAAHGTQALEAIKGLTDWLGWLLSLAVIPASVVLAWWRRRQQRDVCRSQEG